MLLGLLSERLVSCTLAPKLLSGSDCEGPSVSAVNCELGRCCSQGWRLPWGRSQLPPGRRAVRRSWGQRQQLLLLLLTATVVQAPSSSDSTARVLRVYSSCPWGHGGCLTKQLVGGPQLPLCFDFPVKLFAVLLQMPFQLLWPYSNLLYLAVVYRKKLTENLDEERKGWGKNCTKATNKH